MLDSFTQGLSGPPLFPFETRDSTPLSGLSSSIPIFSSTTSNQMRPDRSGSPLGSTSWLFSSQPFFSSLSPQLHSQGFEANAQITSPIENKLQQTVDFSPAGLANLAAFANLKTPTTTGPTSPSSPFDHQPFPLSISELTGVPLKQMPPNAASPNRAGGVAATARRAMAYTVVSPGAPGTPLALPQTTTTAVAQQQPKNPKLYKTEMCRTWIEQGRCNYGDRCQYAHGEHEKRYVPRHPKYKTEMCQSFHKNAYCPYGHRCHFIHSESEVHQYHREKESALRAALSPLTPLPVAPPTQLLGQALLQSTQHSSMVRVPQVAAAGYGSAGESPSSSSADSGSESPAGSFSPGLDLDEACLSPLAAVFAFTAPGSHSTQRSLASSYAVYMNSMLPKLGSTTINTQRFGPGHGGFTDAFPSASPTSTSSSTTTTTARPDEESQMGALLEDIVAWSVDDSRPEKPLRLPVFAQLSNPTQ